MGAIPSSTPSKPPQINNQNSISTTLAGASAPSGNKGSTPASISHENPLLIIDSDVPSRSGVNTTNNIYNVIETNTSTSIGGGAAGNPGTARTPHHSGSVGVGPGNIGVGGGLGIGGGVGAAGPAGIGGGAAGNPGTARTPHQPGSIGVGPGNIGVGGGLGIGGGVGIGGSVGIGGGAAGNPGTVRTPHQPGSIGVGPGNIGIGGGLGIGGGVGIAGPAGIGGGVSKVAAKEANLAKDETKPATPYTNPSKSAVFSKIDEQQEEEQLMEQEISDELRTNEEILKEDTHLNKNNAAGTEAAIPEVIV